MLFCRQHPQIAATHVDKDGDTYCKSCALIASEHGAIMISLEDTKENKSDVVMIGADLMNKTKFGKSLSKKLAMPMDKITRIIIDIPADGFVRIYYETVDSSSLLDLKWGNDIGKIEIIPTP